MTERELNVMAALAMIGGLAGPERFNAHQCRCAPLFVAVFVFAAAPTLTTVANVR